MKTEISKFCEAYLHVLSSLPPAIKTASDRLEQASAEPVLEKPLNALNDVRARLRTLVEKIESQQAYLIIFGPLKSGKSTLMNAISRSYVSEVTSLPGYPCLVYVRNSQEPYFSATRYNGRESVFANGRVLKDVIADSHVALAEQIRVAEERNGSFDPRRDFSEAIRRVDVKLPVDTLAESSTVLVDTPGLYSRMNFGYDVLTREFRDSAACAVFVVKTDNLYLEQVFAEFNDLLGLFSRVFLVINVDSHKRDLQPDGTLLPSTESRDPKQIVEAFKTLSMAGPLRQAYENKRLRIHAVDLLSAASVRLSTGANGHVYSTEEEHAMHKEAFETFITDLTEYLNSSDYTLEFMRDSLRQGSTLCAEVGEIAQGPEFKQLAERQSQLTEELGGLKEKIAATERLLAVDWEATFEKVRHQSSHEVEELARTKATAVSQEMTEALDQWFSGDGSLRDLVDRHWNPILGSAARALADSSRVRLQTLLGGQLGGAEPAAAVMTDLYAVDFDLSAVAQAAAPAIQGAEAVEAYQTSIKDDDIPVKKSFGDWIFFRGAATVRRRIFGDKLDQAIPGDVKQKRLIDARVPLGQKVDSVTREKFPSLPAKYAANLTTAYIARFRVEIIDRLRKKRDQLAGEFAERQTPLERITAVLSSMNELATQSTSTVREIVAMAQQDGTTGHAPAIASSPAPAEPPAAPAPAGV